MNKLISNTSIKYPFHKIKINNNSDFFKKFLNKSKKEIGKETDRLLLLEQNNYINKTFIDKFELSKEKKINLKKFIINNLLYNNISKNGSDISKVNNQKENNNNLSNFKKIQPIKNLFLLKIKNNKIKRTNNSEKESKNNSKINKNKGFEDKKLIFKKINTFRNKANISLLEKTINKSKTIFYNESLEQINNSNKNNNILITSFNYINKNKNKIDNNQKKYIKIYNIKKLIKESRKNMDDIDNNVHNISKRISQNKNLNRFESDGNVIKNKKIMNLIKSELNRKKFGKDFDVLGPVEKNPMDLLRELRTNRYKKKETRKIYMNRTTANIVSFGQVYQEFPDDLFYKERKKIIQDYFTLINDKKIPSKINNKKRSYSTKRLEINLNKIENMINSYKNLIQKINEKY